VEIVKRYEDFPVESFRKMFLKIREQLDEIENSNIVDQGGVCKLVNDLKIDDGQNLKPENNQPLVSDLKIDENGSIVADIENIKAVTVKYYLIDAEILFSRSPFVRDQAT